MSNAPAGWYAPDPRVPTELRYWDGTAWTEHTHTQVPVSAPASGRGGTVKAVVWTCAAVLVFGVMVAVGGARDPHGDGHAAEQTTQAQVPTERTDPVPQTSAEPSPAVHAATPSPLPSIAPSPTVAPSPVATPRPSVTPQPEPGHSVGPQKATVKEGTALAAARALTVKGRAPKTGYAREQFGNAWVDVDRNGCDTRNDQLKLRLTHKVMSGSCKVMAGDLADPYTGTTVHFERGGASEVDIDHLVALSDAWQKGAAKWPFAKRVAFANDPLNLEPVDASANRKKGDGDTATWLPPNKSWRCDYVARQVAVKTKYGVWVTQAEQDAMVRVLGTCPGKALPSFGSQPVIADNTGGPEPGSTPKPAPKPTTSPKPPASKDTSDRDYGTCTEAKKHGAGPYYQGKDEEYSWYRDGDHDGVVCE